MAGKKFIKSDFDIRLGKIITIARHRHGMSQKDLAARLNITFQQIQKYECGDNRLSVARLYDIAKCFDTTVGEMIDGAQSKYITDDAIEQTMDLMYSKMSPAQRRIILQITTALAMYGPTDE